MKVAFIFPYVDCSDINWLSQYEVNYKQYYHLPRVRIMRERFQGFTYLKYIFRGIEYCYPWIDEVVLLLSSSSQKPSWLNSQKVKLIYHDQFIPKEYLPTYNSCTIEMFLHNLPIDADLIIYSNDDFYPIRPLPLSAFFTKQGYPRFNTFLRDPKHLSQFAKTCQEMWINTCKCFNINVEYTDKFRMLNHDMQPMNRRLMIEAEEKFHNFMYSHLEPFRELHQSNQYIYGNYCYLCGRSMSSDRKFQYFKTVDNTVDEVSKCIQNRQCDTLVLNDGGLDYEIWDNNPQILSAFQSLYPVKSKYEL